MHRKYLVNVVWKSERIEFDINCFDAKDSTCSTMLSTVFPLHTLHDTFLATIVRSRHEPTGTNKAKKFAGLSMRLGEGPT